MGDSREMDSTSGWLWSSCKFIPTFFRSKYIQPELFTRLNEEVEREDTGEIVSAGIYFMEQPNEELLRLPSFATYNEVNKG